MGAMSACAKSPAAATRPAPKARSAVRDGPERSESCARERDHGRDERLREEPRRRDAARAEGAERRPRRARAKRVVRIGRRAGGDRSEPGELLHGAHKVDVARSRPAVQFDDVDRATHRAHEEHRVCGV
jgi:hypothetical protein